MEESEVKPAPGRVFLLRDESARFVITSDHFESDWWRARGAELGGATGRGRVHFVRAPDGTGTWVLRHYHRGGWMARLTSDRYLWTGLESTRAWREWRLTRRLAGIGLPVPRVIGARVIRRGLTYTGDLLTGRIEDAITLVDILREGPLPSGAWRQLGAVLRRFHEAGVRHDDLNVANVLRNTEGRFFVIDFDKAAIVPPGAWRERNLARFRRSLDKHARLAPHFAFSETDWAELRAGYAAGGTP